MLMVRIGLCLVAMWAIFGIIALETRRHAGVEAKRFATDVVTLVETGIARQFEVYDLSVQALAENSVDPGILALPADLKHKALYDQSAEASNLGRLFVLDREGRTIETSNANASLGLDFSDRDYFRVQRDDARAGLFLDGPFVGRMTHTPSVAISRRRPTTDGRFIGVAVGSIQLSFFEQMFSLVHLPAESTITLLKQDGTILSRVPFRERYVGVKVPKDFLVGGTDAFGTAQAISVTDGVERLFAFHRVGSLPLYVTVGLSTREIFGNWRWEMLVIGSGFAILTAIIVLLGFNLGGELRRRNEAEHRLAELASTDYLTMLANRRRFDEVLDAEWRRGARARSSLSLMMVDGDFFKTFNDTYGHLEGDRVLRAIATALRTCVDRPGDLVARYGGEEFAVLLPFTSGEGALVVAAAIRAAIDAMDLVHAVSPTGRLTVSIGVACRIPDFSLAPDVLVEAADAALYVAKGEGRDRIVMEGQHAESRLAESRSTIERRVA